MIQDYTFKSVKSIRPTINFCRKAVYPRISPHKKILFGDGGYKTRISLKQ